MNVKEFFRSKPFIIGILIIVLAALAALPF
jgi:hypothetical protein